MSNVVSLHAARNARAGVSPPSDALSFVSKRKGNGGGLNYWTVSPTGDYGADCGTGSALAAEYLAFIGDHPTNGNATLLTCIVGAMVEQAKAGAPWSGVHVGFLAGVNSLAMAAAVMARVT